MNFMIIIKQKYEDRLEGKMEIGKIFSFVEL